MKTILLIVLLACPGWRADAAILYQQPPNPAGGFYVSAWWEPDGSNYDRYVWDAFTLADSANVLAVEWRGTYGASGAPTDFTVALYGSIAAGTQPDFTKPPLLEYQTGGNAGETFAGTFGGVPMYDYRSVLPVPFHADAGVKYWMQVEGWQPGFPDWGLAAGQGGDGSHFLCEHNNRPEAIGVPTGCWFTSRSGDCAFALLSTVPVGVDDRALRPELTIEPVAPNPSPGDRMNVAFSLPDREFARLAAFDVSGRCVAAEDVGALGPGRHVVDLARRAKLRPGLYFIRLSHGAREAAARVAIVH